VIFIFILLCEFSIGSKNKEMKCNFVFGSSTFYFEKQILIIWNNPEYGVLMNYKGRCVYNQCKTCECAYYSANILL
jgi:hypothetical protein